MQTEAGIHDDVLMSGCNVMRKPKQGSMTTDVRLCANRSRDP